MARKKTLTKEQSKKNHAKHVDAYRKKYTVRTPIRFYLRTDDPVVLGTWDSISNKNEFVKWCIYNFGAKYVAAKAGRDYEDFLDNGIDGLDEAIEKYRKQQEEWGSKKASYNYEKIDNEDLGYYFNDLDDFFEE